MTGTYTIRRYHKDDLDQVVRLHFEGLDQMGVDVDLSLEESTPGKLTGWDEDLNDIESHYLTNGDYLVACSGDRIIGMGAVRKISDGTAQVKRMRIVREHQGTGLGSVILDKLTETAATLGCRRLILDTLDSNRQARSFYEHHGFSLYDDDSFEDPHIVFYEKLI